MRKLLKNSYMVANVTLVYRNLYDYVYSAIVESINQYFECLKMPNKIIGKV